MRLIVRRLTIIVLAAIAIVGCDSKPTGNAGDTTSTPAISGRTPRQAADDFVKDLTAGKVTVARLTPEFTKLMGLHTDERAREFLVRFNNTNWVIGDVTTIGPHIVVRGRVESTKGKYAFSLRLAQRGDAFVADWIQLSERMGSVSANPADPDLAAAQDTVRNFLDLLLGGDMRQAHALMLPKWRSVLSPLPPDTKPKDGLDYEPEFLTRMLRSFAGSDVVTYSLSEPKLNPTKNGAMFVIEFETDGKNTPHTIRATKDQSTGQWLVDGFDRPLTK